MIPFEEIDKRLDGIGQNRSWLATVTGRSPDSIRSALAPNSPPKNRTALLQKALSDAIEKEENQNIERPRLPDRITIEAPTDEAREWNRLAAKDGLTVHEWAVIQLNKAADGVIKQDSATESELGQMPTLKVADDLGNGSSLSSLAAGVPEAVKYPPALRRNG